VIRDALVVFRKDLRIERRSKVTTTQIAPFGFIVLILFGFGLGDLVVKSPSEATAGISIRASAVAAGLFWLATLFASLLAVQRSAALEQADRGHDGLRLSGLDPAGIFLGKASAVFVQLVVLEVLLGFGVVLMFGATIRSPLMFVLAAIPATVVLATTGILYATLSAGQRARDTLVPLLEFPLVAPVLLAAAQATRAAFGDKTTNGWPMVRLLWIAAVAFTALGIALFGAVLDD
jgi:heme exporter protein B